MPETYATIVAPKNINGVISAFGTGNHALMINRDASDQHPISAITELQPTLDTISLTIDDTLHTAETAQAVAENALDLANLAGTKANSAFSNASSAKTSASKAVTTSEVASADAKNALTAAEAAQATADSAVKTVNGIAPDENGEVTLDIGSNGIVVTVTGNSTSHSAEEIASHVKAGGNAVLNDGDNLYNFISYGGETVSVTFIQVDQMDAEYFQTAIVSGNTVNFYTMPLALDSAVVKVPDTAEVGQAIIVAEVDENGKPTVWEAVDFPADDHINELINTALGVVENGTY